MQNRLTFVQAIKLQPSRWPLLPDRNLISPTGKSLSPNCCREWAPAACHSKANTQEARLVERKVCFFSGGRQPGERANSCPKANSPPADQRARALKGVFQGCTGGGKGLRVETAQSTLTVVLKLVLHWFDQRHLDLVQLIFSSRVSLFPLLWDQFSEFCKME